MSGGTSRGPSDPLRPFTTTAQVPAVGRFDPRYGGDLGPGVIRVRRPAPLVLRVAVWVTAALLLAGLAGLGIHRLRPSALDALEVHRPSSGPVLPSATTSTTRPHGGASHAAAVSQVATTTTGASFSVSAAEYTVKVSAQAPCWVQATAPGSPAPVFAGTLSPGAQKTFTAVDGQIEVLLGAVRVTVSLSLAGSSTPAWTYTPTSAPYDLRFTSAST